MPSAYAQMELGPRQVPFTHDKMLEQNLFRNYAVNWLRNSPSLAVALKCGIGSSFLKALVKAFDKLHTVLVENSGHSGLKYKLWTSDRRLLGASSLPSTNAP
jgi:hypothetical protein